MSYRVSSTSLLISATWTILFMCLCLIAGYDFVIEVPAGPHPCDDTPQVAFNNVMDISTQPSFQTVISLVFCCDDTYVPVLSVALQSIYDNLERDENVACDIYVLTKSISEVKWKRLEEMNLTSIRLRKVSFEFEPSHLYPDKATRNRAPRGWLLLDLYLSCSVSRVIYLDCNILLQRSIMELWNSPSN